MMPASLPVAFFDIDNTMYDGFSYFALLEAQAAAALIPKQTPQDAQRCMQKYTAKQQDYETTVRELLDIYAAALTGVRYEAALDSAKAFYKQSGKFFPYAGTVIRKLQATHDVVLVTGEPQFVAAAVGELFGVAHHYASVYEAKDGVLTGRVERYLASRHEKHEAIRHLMRGHRAKGSFAFGDSEGDIEMLRAVEYPICLNPTDGLRAVAEKEQWHLPDLSEVSELVNHLAEGR